MVVGVIKSKDDSLRVEMENRFVKAMEELNDQAVPALAEFGPGGLLGREEGDTYLQLCYKGIDAVMTVALIDGRKEPYGKIGNMYQYPASYYYSRIWNYKNIQADLANDTTGKNKHYYWEIIIYDLNTLEAACAMQTRSFTEITSTAMVDDFAKKVIQKLIKKRVLTRTKSSSKPARPF